MQMVLKYNDENNIHFEWNVFTIWISRDERVIRMEIDIDIGMVW